MGKKKGKVSKTKKVAYQLMQHYADQRRMRDLAFYVKLKGLYKNSTIYNFSVRKLSNKMDMSPSTIHGYLKRLEGDGLLRKHSNNLTVSPQKPLANRCGITHLKNVEVCCEGTVEEVMRLMRLEVLGRKQRQAAHVAEHGQRKNVSNDLKREKASHRKAQEYAMWVNELFIGANCYVGSDKDSLQISYVHLGNLLGLSKTGAYYFMRSLDGSLVRKERQYAKLDCSREIAKSNDLGQLFYKNGVLCRQLPNLYKWIA